MSRKTKMAIILSIDSLIIVFASLLSNIYLNSIMPVSRRYMVYALVLQWTLYILFGFIFNVFNRINRYTSINSLISIFAAVTISSGLEFVFFSVLKSDFADLAQTISSYFLTLLLIMSSRIIWRVLVEHKINNVKDEIETKNAFIIGAGDAGEFLYNTLKKSTDKSHLEIKGFIDDDVNKYKTVLSGKKVLGNIEDLPKLVKDYQVEVLTVAIPSMTASEYERLLDITNPLDVKIFSIPSIEELATGQVEVTKLREIDVVDLLGREEVKLDMEVIQNQLTNKVIMVTGAGGSIGSEICRQIMEFSPNKILLLGHGENSIYLIEKELRQRFSKKNTEIVPVIADIRDANRMFEVMAQHRPDIVYHAAAHKHVPLMQYNPTEALKNNIYGTKNVAEASLANDVKSFVMISTDKAVKPPNVMGATKRIAEMIVTGLNGKGTTKFSAVRFGNVLGSRGSVVPLFKEQVAKGGPLTVTDFRMTRYFMTIPEASRLVIQSGSLAKGGEIFILDMGEPVKIYDLAKKIIKLSGYTENEIAIIETGIRPGEKLYEELLVDKEISKEQVHDKIFVGNVNGFTYDEVIEKVNSLPNDEESLSRELIGFANLSSEE
ncbi:nucleoside-diphosphate sugar epimerase/dehydratase [Vagococcus carniphilus]|uniref:polysaccharide biosynthesis protein n=1 Tax=Vagococcus carniphilus TaxID=218144 RepID=UPI00288E24F6|nr:nucleoside-diphosphate sugar epimerase/dehydratase [Vagococcus carniphilus]MDT2830940.1 nucleoside-diphosphate sugar epimerase/dehydratase [Vagococcus carniphilus]MDT2838163.1 nucleoside-diphosphate sugar epimerase/dehydratase [Vagococcus carniphilus]MDT2853676.1 nucleoside-diphosphate sugar epimerase/dehydratase [Vagococcus carniphilus]